MDLDLKKGALHRQLGRGKNYKFTKSELERLKKIETGQKFHYPPGDEKERKMTPLLKKRVVFALNFGYRNDSPRGGVKNSSYSEMIDDMNKSRDDHEAFHMKRDEIMCRFFIDMENGKFKTKKEIREVSALIYNYCVNIPDQLWFA